MIGRRRWQITLRSATGPPIVLATVATRRQVRRTLRRIRNLTADVTVTRLTKKGQNEWIGRHCK